jgi:hypothetical protein
LKFAERLLSLAASTSAVADAPDTVQELKKTSLATVSPVEPFVIFSRYADVSAVPVELTSL